MNQKKNITYAPGVCNIDATEIQQRKYTGYTGLFITVFVVVISLIHDWGSIATFAAAFLPSFLAALGFLQARSAFCADYGLRGKYKSDDIGEVQAVPDSDKSANKRRAIKIIGKSIILATVASLALAMINSVF